jgi:short-subunit dehydrogenase
LLEQETRARATGSRASRGLLLLVPAYFVPIAVEWRNVPCSDGTSDRDDKYMKLKNLSAQTIVITGATSGIGLVTARMASARGANVVLVARSKPALEQLTSELRMNGGRAEFVVADVAKEEELRRAAEVARESFGGFDTWINDAAVLIYGRNQDVSREDQRRLFETDFWGVVDGSLIAVEQLKHRGGALINIGSEVSDHATPLQGIYVASKHAVKGFTDSLRIELEQQRAKVSVTLIKPAAIDTPIIAHAKNYMDREPDLPPPMYAPELVAKAILFAAEHPRRDMYVGGSAKLNAMATYYTPRLADKYTERFTFNRLQKDWPRLDKSQNNLYEPRGRLQERQGQRRRVLESSAYTAATMHAKTTLMIAGALGLIALAVLYRKDLRGYLPAASALRSFRRRIPDLPDWRAVARHRLSDLRHHLPLSH